MLSREPRWRRWLARLISVSAVDVGKADDGLTLLTRPTGLDKSWNELSQEFTDALEAWRKNPLARRMVGLTTAYVVGDGIRLTSEYAPLRRYLERFMDHPRNRVLVREGEWCDELSRTGELFIVLHFNPADGVSYVRTVPASAIDRITWAAGDYETELTYHEAVSTEDEDYDKGGRTWLSSNNERVLNGEQEGRYLPVMLHFAINRPVGCVRGESDLAPILVWLKRYSRWLEDRVRLNAAIRAFLWVVKVPARLVQGKVAQYARPPEPGTVVVSEQGAEEWEAVTPDLHAADAEQDGRAIRWMVAAGGLGTALIDFGEAETSNLATAKAMSEQRLRFMRRRQVLFSDLLIDVALAAYNRAERTGRLRGRTCVPGDIIADLPDMTKADNADLGRAAQSVAGALATLAANGAAGPTYLRTAVRLVLQFAGEVPDEDLIEAIAEESKTIQD